MTSHPGEVAYFNNGQYTRETSIQISQKIKEILATIAIAICKTCIFLDVRRGSHVRVPIGGDRRRMAEVRGAHASPAQRWPTGMPRSRWCL